MIKEVERRASPNMFTGKGQLEGDGGSTVALVVAGACGLGLVGVGVLAFAVEAGHERDAAMLHGFTGLYAPTFNSAIRVTAQLADPVPYTCLGLLCIAVALVRRRTWRALAVAIVLIGTGLTTQALKQLLAQPRYADWLIGGKLDDASWPSGHATAAMALALCGVVVASPAWRTATALLGVACSVALAYATLALTWHYPSDVLAGFLVAGLGASAALVGLSRVEVDYREPRCPPRFVWLLAGGTGGVVAATAVAGAASGRVALDTADRLSVVAGALAVAGLGLALVVATVIAAPGPGAGQAHDA
jgi:membrane-associated phospholipid phosphatase